MDFSQTLRERLDPTALHFKSISVERFRPIQELAVDFGHHNVITGFHGTGKTSLLHLLAGIAGTDNATRLIAGEKVGRIEVVLGAGNEEYRFTATDSFDAEAIDSFKATLPDGKRANLAMTDYYVEQFQHGCVDYDTFQSMLSHFFERSGHKFPHVFTRPGHGARIDPGSGISQAIRLLLLGSMHDGPLLLEHPETSLDHRNKLILSRMIATRHKQTFAVTYSEEWPLEIHKNIDLDKKGVDK